MPAAAAARDAELDRPAWWSTRVADRRARPARRARRAHRSGARARLGRAHFILDWNIALDKAREETRKTAAIGTTGRGIGPTYEDKVARRGIRVADLLDPASLRDTVLRVAAEKNFELREVHHWPTVDADAIYAKACDYGRKLAPYVDHTGRSQQRCARRARAIRRAQGTASSRTDVQVSDVSNCVACAACTGSGWADAIVAC